MPSRNRRRKGKSDLGVNEQILSLAENGKTYVRLSRALILSVYLFVFQTSSPLSPRISSHLIPVSRLYESPLGRCAPSPCCHYSLTLRRMWDITQPVWRWSSTPRGAAGGQDKTQKSGLPGKSAEDFVCMTSTEHKGLYCGCILCIGK